MYGHTMWFVIQFFYPFSYHFITNNCKFIALIENLLFNRAVWPPQQSTPMDLPGQVDWKLDERTHCVTHLNITIFRFTNDKLHLLNIGHIQCSNIWLFLIKLDKFDFSLIKFNTIEDCSLKMICMVLLSNLIPNTHEA